MVNLSVIIVNWNTRKLLKKCLESIVQSLGKEKSRGLGVEIIVVDNGSNDGSVEEVKNFKSKIKVNGLEIKLIKNQENFGFAKANNQAIKVAKGNYILLLNSDTEVVGDALKVLVDFLEKHSEVAAVSPMLLNTDGSRQLNYYMKFPNLWQIFFYHNVLFRPLAMKTSFLREKLFCRVADYPFLVDQLPGAALMARKEVFVKTGGLSEDFWFLFEDVDWSYRVWQMRLGKLMVISKAKIIHLGGASWLKKRQENPFGFYKQYFGSLLLFVKKYYQNRLSLYRWAIGLVFFFHFCLHTLMLNKEMAIVYLKLLSWIAKKTSFNFF